MTEVTLDNCHNEPIHIPGSIQSHGYMLVVSPADMTIRYVSENLKSLLKSDYDEILGRRIDLFLGAEPMNIISACIADQQSRFHKINPLRAVIDQQAFDVIVNQSEDLLLLDLEKSLEGSTRHFETQYHQIRDFLNNIIELHSPEQLFTRVADEIRDITGFDRVMVYKFDHDYNGEVIAEAKKEELNSFLKQHFPESDIPQQARTLYIKNRVRLLVDVDAPPSPLYPNDYPVNLSSSTLRSVSPIHLQYLRNMGVAASMSISITFDNKLWGLIACHHNEPYIVPFTVRESAAYIGLTLSHLVAVREQEAHSRAEMHAQAALSDVVKQMASQSALNNGLRRSKNSLLDLVKASGVAWCIDEKIETFGTVPDKDLIHGISEVLSAIAQDIEGLHYTDSLASQSDRFKEIAKDTSGALMLVISTSSATQKNYIIWFRKELIQTKNWGGKPEKVIEFRDDGSHRLMPRSSFALWVENVKHKSSPWTDIEKTIALKLRNTLADYILAKTEKLEAENRDLEKRVEERTESLLEQIEQRVKAQQELQEALAVAEGSNNQLEKFAYVASHDLQEPLRKIQSFGSRIEKLVEPEKNPKLSNYLKRMIDASNRAQVLINDLLSFSRIDRSSDKIEPVDLNKLIDEIKSDLHLLILEKRATLTTGNLPLVVADEQQIYRVFLNLIQNSLKFSAKGRRPLIVIDVVEDTKSAVTFKVQDNGIGFEQQYKDKVFELFQRLHGRQEYEGTGLGLAISQKIMERHKGRIWTESEPNVGTSMYVQFHKPS